MSDTQTVQELTEDLSKLPDGLRLRPYAGEADLADIVRIENAESVADRIPERTTLDGERASMANPGEKFDPARDVTIAMVGDEMVGYARREWVDLWDTDAREYRLDGVVHPDWRRRGIGTFLLRDSERRSRKLAAVHDTTRPRILGSWSSETQTGDETLLRANGYKEVRWFFDMVRPNLDDIPNMPLADGLEIRAVTSDLVRRVWNADIEAFQDHWGGFDSSDESFQRWIGQPTFDPTLWIIAFDGEEPAGGVINRIDAEENEALGIKRGWVGSVWTRRPWRRRGIAKATIAMSLEVLRDRGMTTAALGVDADNPSGALGLYEALGFEVDFRSTAWRKPFEGSL